MTALRARDHGMAQGQVIDLSLLEPMFSVLGPEAAIYKVTGKVKERAGSALEHLVAAQRLSLRRWQIRRAVRLDAGHGDSALFEIIGRPDMIADPRFAPIPTA